MSYKKMLRNSSQPSFKDKLLGRSSVEKNEEEIVVEVGDVTVDRKDLVPKITFSERIKALMEDTMRLSVFIKLLGGNVRPSTLYDKIVDLWKPTGPFKLTELEGGCFIVKFEEAEDYENALTGGPWVFRGHYLSVHPWQPSISPTNLVVTKIAAWVRLPGLPYHYYHKSVLRAIGNVIGEVLKIDYSTQAGDKARFARLVVILDLTKPLISKINLDGHERFIEYEGLPTICYECGCYGHLEANCPKITPTSAPSTPSTASPSVPPSSSTATDLVAREPRNYGPWMQVQRRNRKPDKAMNRVASDSFHSHASEGNRFQILSTSETTPSNEKLSKQQFSGSSFSPLNRAGAFNGKNKGDFNKKLTPREKGPKPPQPREVQKSTSEVTPNATIFDSPAYKAMHIPTTVNQGNYTAVVVTDSRMALNPITSPSPNPFRPGVKVSSSLALGKENALPKAPDKNPHKAGVRVQSNVKIKGVKTRPKDVLTIPSDALTSALAEALGVDKQDDEDMVFDEAQEIDSDDDFLSGGSDKEH